MNEKRQTAIEWLFDNLNLCFDKFDNGEYSYTEFVNASNEIKEEAKIIEKKQIRYAYIDGIDDTLKHCKCKIEYHLNSLHYYKKKYTNEDLQTKN